MVTISFPGLGIEPFTVNPVAFTIPIFGGIEVRWYGLIITLGIVLAFTYASYRAKHEEIKFDDVIDITLFTVIAGVIGARLYYVLTSLDSYHSIGEVFAIWEGGLAIYGAVIAGALTIYLCCRHKKIKPLKMLDATAPGVMIGQILGRWGNFFNGEAYGAEVMESSLLYPLRMGLLPNIESHFEMHYFHPTFFYESMWNLIGFLLIHFLYKKKKFDGQILLMYLTWYGFGRMFIEGLRTDSLYVGVFRISQVVGFVCFVVGTALLIVGFLKARRERLTETEEYTPIYSKITRSSSTLFSPKSEEQTPAEDTAEATEATETTESEEENKNQESNTDTEQNETEE